MTLLKVLQLVESGLITHQKFPQDQVHSPFFTRCNHSYDTHGLTVTHGSLYYFLEGYDRIVLEVVNDYQPQAQTDFGGISITKGEFVTSLYEYASEFEDRNFKYTRVYKDMYTFHGEGSEDGVIWVDKSEMRIPKPDTMGVSVKGETPYTIKELKLYKEPFFYIMNLYENYIVNLYDMDRTLVKTMKTDRSTIAKIAMPNYPFDGTIEIVSPDNRVVAYQQVENLWGGDRFISTLDIELFDSNGINLRLEEAKHLGEIKDGGEKLETITVVNNGDGFLADVRISILKDSPAYDWVYLSEDLDGNGYYDKEVSLYLKPRGTAKFLIRIKRPTGSLRGSGFRNNDEEAFYLVVCGDGPISEPKGFLFAPAGQEEGYRGILNEDGILEGTDRLYK